ncbi:MAG TPA: DegT/DnrJ/EryC1/StrS family aminotransferase, partial [Nocardioides sp.]|nr:DegT/DnrJ/EryC1/StrS family aminotransferase [Nocardioides sp.]
RAADRDRLQARLHDRDIESRVYYPTPVHQLPAFNAKADLPRTIEAARCVLSLPVGPQLSAGDVAAVAAAVAESSGG